MNSFYTKDEIEKRRAEENWQHDADYPNEQQSDTEPSWHLWGNDEDGWDIWLNPDKTPDTGLCIGHGKTKHGAIENAVGVLNESIHVLRRML